MSYSNLKGYLVGLCALIGMVGLPIQSAIADGGGGPAIIVSVDTKKNVINFADGKVKYTSKTKFINLFGKEVDETHLRNGMTVVVVAKPTKFKVNVPTAQAIHLRTYYED